MGREVRRVPVDWVHPKDDKGSDIPYRARRWVEAEATHYQMYENVSEGTPISPVMESPEALARWLAENGVNAGAGMTATYEQWLRVCNGGYAPSMVSRPGRGLESGVAGLTE